MRTANVIVLPYDRAWKSAFEEIKKEIENTIGDLFLVEVIADIVDGKIVLGR